MSSSSRLKREDCNRTHHDSVFSRWEILIGSTDWEDYSLGKDGVDRYRTHNLPNCSSCPGLYELGVAAIPSDEGCRLRKHDSKNIFVVYLGQTNNVRTRLQQYGRAGAHLGSGKLVASLNKNESPGLFTEIFSTGYSIMFRWAPMIDKKKAEKTEAGLLAVFDYAWNKSGNGACRHDEILSKLDSEATRPISIVLRMLQPWKHPTFGRKAGINIDASVPLDDQIGFLPQVLKFSKSQLQFIHGNHSRYEDHEICGVAIGNGSVCKNMPLFRRKRCEEHKGKKVIGADPVFSSGVIATEESTNMCGIVLEDGSLCVELAAHGRKRCELHNGRRITKLELHNKPSIELSEILNQLENPFWKCQPQLVKEAVMHEEEYNICGVVYGHGTVCRNKPVFGRKRCLEHKGQRVSETKLELPISREGWETKADGEICGVVSDGYVCRRKPVSGRKRCDEHKGRRITGLVYQASFESLVEKGNSSVCGVVLGNGSTCRKPPVPGRKRCELHKGRRIT